MSSERSSRGLAIRRARAAAALLLFAALLPAIGGCQRASPPAAESQRRASVAPGTPVFEPRPAAAMSLETSPLGISPDGFARWLVRVHFTGADGAPTRLVSGGDIAFTPSHGSAQWQTRARFGGPAAIVSTTLAAPLAVSVRASPPLALEPRRTATDTSRWRGPRVVAAALGPHVVELGWFPQAAGPVRIVRAQSDGTTRLAVVTGPSSSYRDGTVVPGSGEHYIVSIPGRGRFALHVAVPPQVAHVPIAALGGKAMWLSFSPVMGEADGYDSLRPAALVARATQAGIRVIELRAAYGPFDEITPQARGTIDALVDAAAARGIRLVAWTVPRATDFDDLRAAVAATEYRTPRGHGVSALAVDLERGDEYLGSGPSGYAAIGTYIRRLRAALGSHYPILATVEDPYLGHLTNAEYPYAAIASEAGALQPMTYWRMMSAYAVTPSAVERVVRESFAKTRIEARRSLPIDMGGQTVNEGPRGAPSGAEVIAAVRAARAAGALGITFFDWNGTNGEQWAALARAAWPAAAP